MIFLSPPLYMRSGLFHPAFNPRESYACKSFLFCSLWHQTLLRLLDTHTIKTLSAHPHHSTTTRRSGSVRAGCWRRRGRPPVVFRGRLLLLALRAVARRLDLVNADCAAAFVQEGCGLSGAKGRGSVSIGIEAAPQIKSEVRTQSKATPPLSSPRPRPQAGAPIQCSLVNASSRCLSS